MDKMHGSRSQGYRPGMTTTLRVIMGMVALLCLVAVWLEALR